MPTARSEHLRALAGRVADELPNAVTDAVLTGSTSRGVADELSDIELLVVADRLPSPEECAAAAGRSGVETWVNPESPIVWTGGFRDGEFVELVWWQRESFEQRVAAIAAGEIVDHRRVRTAEAIVNGVALRGRRHAEWCAQLAEYPAGLAEAIVADAVADWLEPLRAAQALLRPGDALVLAQRLTLDAENILRVAFATNRVWEPGWKRLAERVDELGRVPDRLAERLDAALRALDVAEMRALASEVLALAPQSEQVRRAREYLAVPV